MKTKFFSTFFVLSLLTLLLVPTVFAATDCTFAIDDSTMTLESDCTTDETIIIPDNYTLNGNGFTITAVDPSGDHFRGAVVQNGGDTAYVHDLTVTVSGLTNACDNDDDRLRGILFEGASGAITHSTVVGINQGPSGCQEGNAIEVRNAPFDGTHPNTQTVDVRHNTVLDYQKTGIVANGDVEVTIEHNEVGASATQENLAANSIQVGFGANGVVQFNQIDGNQWLGTSNWGATAVLVYEATANVSNNNIRGNADIGIYIYGENGIYDNNRVFDEGADETTSCCDIGIANWGTNNTVTKNKVRGYEIPYEGDVDDNNKVIGNPSS